MRQQCRQEHRASEHELLQRIKVLWAADIAIAKAIARRIAANIAKLAEMLSPH